MAVLGEERLGPWTQSTSILSGPCGVVEGAWTFPGGVAVQSLSSQPRIPDPGSPAPCALEKHPTPRPTVSCHLASPCPCPHPTGVGESWPWALLLAGPVSITTQSPSLCCVSSSGLGLPPNTSQDPTAAGSILGHPHEPQHQREYKYEC